MTKIMMMTKIDNDDQDRSSRKSKAPPEAP